MVLDPNDDAATVNYGKPWRMPTKEEIRELLKHTTNRWVTNYKGIKGLNGRLFISKINGNSIFIPAAGYCEGSDINDVGSYCYLWSSSLNLDYTYDAYYFDFNSDHIIALSCNRCDGFSVRPVMA